MKKYFLNIRKYLFGIPIRNIFGRPCIKLAALRPSKFRISIMRKLNAIQISADQLKVISTIVKEKAPCKLLIFGLGYDSMFWSKLNQGGVTIFLEDNKEWYQRITKSAKDLKAYLVNYNTKITDWRMLLESPSLLDMTLPNNLDEEEWDIILVDAPEGWNDQTPGRMKSIYLSSKLVNSPGDIFVHDCEREVEDTYCNIFLKKENLKLEMKSSLGILRHYYLTNH